MGHSFIRFPHFVQVTMWPHSNRTQSMTESIQILQRFSSEPGRVALPDGAGTTRREEGFLAWETKISGRKQKKYRVTGFDSLRTGVSNSRPAG